MKHFIIAVFISLISTSAYAWSECSYEAGDPYLDMTDDGNEIVWVPLEVDGNVLSIIYKRKSNAISQEQINRFYSMVLTAKTTGKRLKVRFPDDGIICSESQDARGDFIGIRLID